MMPITKFITFGRVIAIGLALLFFGTPCSAAGAFFSSVIFLYHDGTYLEHCTTNHHFFHSPRRIVKHSANFKFGLTSAAPNLAQRFMSQTVATMLTTVVSLDLPSDL
jgi:hypothetical protein